MSIKSFRNYPHSFKRLVRQSQEHVGLYVYCVPNFLCAGACFKHCLDYLSEEIISIVNHSALSFLLKNGSEIRIMKEKDLEKSQTKNQIIDIAFSEDEFTMLEKNILS